MMTTLSDVLNEFAHKYNPLHFRARIKDMLPEDRYRYDIQQHVKYYEEIVYKPLIKILQVKIKYEVENDRYNTNKKI